jgi:glycerophosphoryl diester phosphodiesterase
VCKNKRNDPWQVLGSKFIQKKTNQFVDFAHSLGLVVHPWQMANDQHKISDDPILEYVKLSRVGVDGFFSDYCDSGLFAVQHLENLNFSFDNEKKTYSYNLK